MFSKQSSLSVKLQRPVTGYLLSGNRSFATAIATDKKTDGLKVDPEWENARPFGEIPGPSAFQFFVRFLPGGKYHNKKLFDVHKIMRAEYGDILMFPGLFKRNPIVFTFSENSIEKMFRTEGLQPVRNGQDSVFYYRKELRKDQYGNKSGLITEHGEHWADIRSKVNPILLVPKTVKKYIPTVDEVSLCFIERMRKLRSKDNEMPKDFGQELNKWALESIGTIALDTRLGCLDERSNPEAERFIRLIRQFFELSYEVDVLPSLWRYFKTPKFNKLMKVFDELNDYVTLKIDDAIQRLKANPNHDPSHEESVLEKLLKIDRPTAVIMASDMLLAGVDTTSSYLISCIYQLAINPDKQELLREEVNKMLPTKESKITESTLLNAPYLRACLKEALRLNPVAPGNFRATGNNIVLNGYRIPKGMDVAMGNVVLGWDNKHFDQWEKFIPERWLKRSAESQCPVKSAKDVHPFVYLPFGHGPRTCIGRRFAELEVEVMLLRLLKEFKIEWKYGPLEYRTGLVNFPSTDLKFTCIDIN